MVICGCGYPGLQTIPVFFRNVHSRPSFLKIFRSRLNIFRKKFNAATKDFNKSPAPKVHHHFPYGLPTRAKSSAPHEYALKSLHDPGCSLIR